MAIKCPECKEEMQHACTMIDRSVQVNAAGKDGLYKQYEHGNNHEPLSCNVVFVRVYLA